MSLKLHEITKEMEAFEEMYESCINEETGEIVDADTIKLLEEQMNDMLMKKGEGIIKYFINKEAEIKAIKTEEDRLKKKRVSSENKLDNFKNYIMINMLKIGTKKIETPIGNISVSNSKSTIVDDKVCPHDARYWTPDDKGKFDKKVIKKLLESGEKIAGASISENTTVNIK